MDDFFFVVGAVDIDNQGQKMFVCKTNCVVPHFSIDLAIFKVSHVRVTENVLGNIKTDAMIPEVCYRLDSTSATTE
jgi:hypothetical protein